MRIFISADMEGISGIVHPSQLSPTGANYERGRLLMTGDVNAVVEGVLSVGATEIVVNDSHWVQRNLLLDQLHPRARLVSGSTKELGMVQGVVGSDLAFFIGYHAKYGTPYAVADHTWSAPCLSDLRINGDSMGEVGLNALLCGHFGVRIAMLSGDQALEAEAKALLPQASVAVVKHATGRWAAECLSLEDSRRLLRECAQSATATAEQLQPLSPPQPCEVEMELVTTEMADRAQAIPTVQREGGRVLRFTSEHILEAFHCFRTVMNAASIYTDF
ncbi:MAG: M55 family metallopeptidase [Chloroflexota bacterium]|nr:M55 family metallopeptidase [Chloroflexota bacterium]